MCFDPSYLFGVILIEYTYLLYVGTGMVLLAVYGEAPGRPLGSRCRFMSRFA